MNEHKFGNEYPGLAIISGICKIIGSVIVVIAVIGLFYGFSLLNHDYGEVERMGVILIFSSILCGIVFSVPFFAFGELIKVFVRIELNTRKGYVADTTENVANTTSKKILNGIETSSYENIKNDKISEDNILIVKREITLKDKAGSDGNDVVRLKMNDLVKHIDTIQIDSTYPWYLVETEKGERGYYVSLDFSKKTHP